MTFEPFDILETDLEGSNLIEASAGTGKTYSLVMSVLRLILEKEINLPEILMVTFTNAAVAELEIRVREVIQRAQQYEQLKEDDHIRILIEKAITNTDVEAVKERLKKALLQLDELSIFTIHGFCQRVLQQYAFETKQVFDVELLHPEQMDAIRENAIDQYWRQHFIALDRADFELIQSGKYITKHSIQEVVKAIQGQKEVYPDFYNEGITIGELMHQFRQKHQRTYDLYETVKIEHHELLKDEFDNLPCSNSTTEKFRPYLSDATRYINFFFAQKSKKRYCSAIKKHSDQLHQQIGELEHYRAQIDEAENELTKQLFASCAHQIQEIIVKYKQDKGLLNFDDLIVRVHQEIKTNDNRRLIQLIRKKFKAAFIDEFQDTDLLQFDIFHCLFQQSKQHILFYVGDPKQSIYSFRKADINTYFKARESGINTYRMDRNFRSSYAFVKAHNDLFDPYEGYDSFLYANEDTTLAFNRVQFAAHNTGVFKDKTDQIKAETGILLLERNEKDTATQICQLIKRLLDPQKSCIQDKEGTRPIRPSDICILFRGYTGTKQIHTQLSKEGIKSILYKDQTVFQSQSAKDILHFMQAIEDPTHSRIRQIMITDMMAYPIDQVADRDESPLLQFLFQLKQIWTHKGIYYLLSFLIDRLSLRSRASNMNDPFSQRHLSDYLQLMEIIQKKQKRMKWSPSDLIRWFDQQLKDRENTEEDEDVQRLESEADSVSMMSIHKSKGLEFPIVICEEFKSGTKSGKDKYSSVYQDGQYHFHVRSLMNPEQELLMKTDEAREDRRLLYVAVTRAKYLCCLIQKDNEMMAPLIQYFKENESTHIDIQPIEMVEEETYRPPIEQQYFTQKTIPKIQLIEKNWDKLSYSSIVLGVELLKSKKNSASRNTDHYDQYIFTNLSKGASTGNLLHFIFENISFSDNSRWHRVIDRALMRFKRDKEKHAASLLEMLDHVLHASLHDGHNTFPLSAIPDHKILAEMEFNIPLQPFKMSQLAALSSDKFPFHIGKKGEWEGLLNGFIDLFFEHEGVYYILDWKSNHLGSHIDAYTPDHIHQAMSESNYHLQYHLYTVALVKYLTDRLPSFDYDQQFGGAFYVFVRGVRKEQQTGIFHHKPSWQIIQQMMQLFS